MGCQDQLHSLAKGLQSLPHLQHLLRQLHHLRGGWAWSEWSQDLPNSRHTPPCPSPTACRSLSNVSVFLTSLGPRGTVSRPFSVDSRMGLPARAGK